MSGWNPERPADGLHNMSAPPRTRVTVRPLRASTTAWKISGQSHSNSTSSITGLSPVALISVERLIRHWFPDYLDIGTDHKGPAWRDHSRLKGRAACLKNLRLRCLVVLSQVAVGELKRPNRQSVSRLADTRVERLEETYLDKVRRLDPLDQGLPPFGLVRSVGRSSDGFSASETDPARALSLLSRCSGTVYCAGREPLLPDYNRNNLSIKVFGFENPTKGKRS